MPDIRPFHGIRYNPEKIPDLSLVVAPPYDVIDPGQHEKLMEKDPYNVVRLILGSRPGQPGDYPAGAALMERWLREGVLIRDEVPCLYLIEHTFTLPWRKEPFRRWAVVGRVRLEPLESGRIFAHERTHSGPKEDRLRLIRAFQGNLSQVFSLFDGDHQSVRSLIDPVFSRTPLADMQDENGIRRRFWNFSDPDMIRGFSSRLSHRNLYIADGHHRYETALAYSREMAASDPDFSPGRGYNFVMMAMVGMNDPGLAILPIHRLLYGLENFHFEKVLRDLSPIFSGKDLSREDALAFGADSSHVFLGGRGFILYEPAARRFVKLILREDVDLEKRMPDVSRPIQKLEATLAERFLLMESLGMTSGQISRQEHIIYYHDLTEALTSADRNGQLLLIMPSTDLDDLVTVTRKRERMPQKSTFFYPKLLSGLVFYDHGFGDLAPRGGRP